MLAVELFGENTKLLNLPGRQHTAVTAGWRLARWFRGAGLDLQFPTDRSGCGAEIDSAENSPFCADRVTRLALVRSAVCMRCGALVPGEHSRERCFLCLGTKLWFDEALVLGEYEGSLRDWMLKMKERNGESLALVVAELIWQRSEARLSAMRPDVVLAVDWLRQTRHTQPQFNLPLSDRLANVRNALALRPGYHCRRRACC